MPLKTLERPAFTVVGMHIRTKPMAADIPALWPRFVPRIGEIAHPAEPKVSYGVMWNEGGMEVLHYMAAVSVTNAAVVPKGMEPLDIAPATYASFRYPISGLAKGFAEIHNRLLPNSGLVQIPAPHFERYDEAFDPMDSGSLVEICIPVRTR